MTDVPKYCSHGKAIEGECLECSVVWHRDQMEASLRNVKRHSDKIAELGAMLMRARASKKATSFLVGDPAKGVPLRNPMAHEIAEAIERIPIKALKDQDQ